jgi:uncharacterized protein YgiM (DUF1202 family)
MRNRIAISIPFLFILFILSGCGLFSNEQEIDNEDTARTSAAKTLSVMSAAETIAAQTLAVPEEIEETVITEEATPLPNTETPTQMPSATNAVPMAMVSENTNCRTGPGVIYDWVSILMVGQKAEVVARSADGSYWVIQNPEGAGTCWLWGYYATVEGSTANLPVWDAPPTPTSPPLPTIPPLTRNLRLTSPYMSGDDVLQLQQRLLDLGYEEIGTADGTFGPKTDQAVRQFQTLNGLAVDGIVGQTTWEAIFSSTAVSP